jgi:hypothetical protein
MLVLLRSFEAKATAATNDVIMQDCIFHIANIGKARLRYYLGKYNLTSGCMV